MQACVGAPLFISSGGVCIWMRGGGGGEISQRWDLNWGGGQNCDKQNNQSESNEGFWSWLEKRYIKNSYSYIVTTYKEENAKLNCI